MHTMYIHNITVARVGPAPCDGIRCMNGYRCEVYQPTNEGYCEPDCETLNPCLPGELCEVEQVLCKRAPCPGKLRCRGMSTPTTYMYIIHVVSKSISPAGYTFNFAFLFLLLLVDCNLVDCRVITAADCSGGAILLADPTIGRCCDICGEEILVLLKYALWYNA